MAALTVHPLSRAGVDVLPVATDSDGDQFGNTGQEFIVLRNESGAAWTVTITTHGSVDGLAIPDREVTVDAGAERLVGPFPPAVYNDADGLVELAHDNTSNTFLQVFRLVRGA